MTTEDTTTPDTATEQTVATKDVWYTFGNHFHWVDMQWLWGYDTLPRSVQDMLAFIDATGTRGNVNFDVVGYERMAAERPQALAQLRDAVQAGTVEPVGCTYGQPYALFHHAESALRQLVHGARAVSRLLGVTPKSFWEEEFFFFPQLPQMLTDCGFRYASLFFQWTWHTPHVPVEEAPAIWWEGIDGSRILTAPRTTLNLHQWPEDFDAIRRDPLLTSSPAPVVQQWLELLPSPDWMCRSELLLPGMRELESLPGTTLRPGTLSEVLEAVREHAVVRGYTMDDVFHGMSVGKNGDHGHRRSRRLEQDLLAAELQSVLAGRLGRPYPHWDAYPEWELDECWRELLAFQHHDNDECEGLCGHVGYAGLDRADAISRHIRERTAKALARRVDAAPGELLLMNPLGWEHTAVLDTTAGRALVRVPAAGYAAGQLQAEPIAAATATLSDDGRILCLGDGAFSVDIDVASGTALRLEHSGFGATELTEPGAGAVRRIKDATEDWFDAAVEVNVVATIAGDEVHVRRVSRYGDEVLVRFSLAPEHPALDVEISAADMLPPDGRQHAALMTPIEPVFGVRQMRADTQYAIGEVHGRGRYIRKYPTGEWMTSPQVFEDIIDPFTALQLVDFLRGDDTGLLVLHDGSQGFFTSDDGAWNVLSMKDPWDEEYWRPQLRARLRLMPHAGLSDTRRWQLAQEFTRPVWQTTVEEHSRRDVAASGSVLHVDGGPVLTALYRESSQAGIGFDRHASHAVELGVFARLVEFDGRACTARVMVDGQVAAAWTCDPLGRLGEPVAVRHERRLSVLELTMRPHQIATIVFDLVEARKQPRNLDAHREVWATVHRVDDEHTNADHRDGVTPTTGDTAR